MSSHAAKRRSRAWWLWRLVRAYHKHGCLRYRGIRGTWADAMIGRNMMAPAEQWKLGPIGSKTNAEAKS